MDNKYFGSLDQKELEKLNDKEKIKYLLDNGYLTETYASSGLIESSNFRVMEATISVNPDNLEYRFNTEIAEELYNFLLNHYGHNIGTDLALFNINFDDETFGLSEKKKRKKGLTYFDIFFKSTIEDRQIGARYNSEHEVRAEKRFKTLFDTKQDLIHQLKKSSKFLIDYLLGDTEKFDKNLFDSTLLIQSILRFENNLLILRSLNKRFNIEKEDFFTPKSRAMQIYKKYSNDFYSLKQLEFIEQELSDKSNLNHSYIVSLFYFFKEEHIKIPKEKKFRSIINEFFNTDFSRLKVSDSTNETHQKRLDFIKSKWSKF